jgi:hypothetical protein
MITLVKDCIVFLLKTLVKQSIFTNITRCQQISAHSYTTFFGIRNDDDRIAQEGSEIRVE